MNRSFTDKYNRITEQIDRLSATLAAMHQNHLMCRKGCAFCCMDYSIFPVEFHALGQKLKNREIKWNADTNEDECIFLIENVCSIYEFRPVICRTHGLPLLFVNDSGDWELSVCELNFTEFEEEFHVGNTFPQDKFNSKLFMLNKEFIGQEENNHYNKFELIPLSNLQEFLI